MLIADSDLGQTTIARRGAGNMFGPGHFSVTSFPRGEGGDEMFGGLGEESLFGLGQVLSGSTSEKVRSFAFFVATAGGSAYALSSVGAGKDQTAKVAIGAIGVGLAALSLLNLGIVFGLVSTS